MQNFKQSWKQKSKIGNRKNKIVNKDTKLKTRRKIVPQKQTKNKTLNKGSKTLNEEAKL